MSKRKHHSPEYKREPVELVDDDSTRALLIHAAALGPMKGCADAIRQGVR